MMLFGEILLGVLAVIGLAALCRGLASVLLRPGQTGCVALILPLRGNIPDAEHRLRYMASQFGRLARREDLCSLLCLDDGMEEETRKVCETLCGEFPFMNVCTREQLQKLL